ncbi:Cystathionine gamma-synthase [Fusarium oxysporum f. sp. cubense race 1]|uniref:cystathionine gamma-synthase n=1 Tax=Fusarium oxysporum f. sp. cubense (strain race 1) TaxID=1229664 RepID=N4TXB8_FUSC1|nr:Cystathionine gamma-synthase [Fusarium oxysporum f. sp. cubense race 1]
MPEIGLGESIPPDTAHAVSVSLPTWKANVGYEEGEDWVVNRMTTGYPRFFVHKGIQAFAKDIVDRYPRVANRCLDFILQRISPELASQVRNIDFTLDKSKELSPVLKKLTSTISAVVYPSEVFPIAKQYWQHTGEGTSSRRAEFCHGLFKDDLLIPAARSRTPPEASQGRPFRGPRRYTRPGSIDGVSSPAPSTPKQPSPETPVESLESSRFLEERFGRNLDLSMVERAKSAIRRRIAGAMAHDVDLNNGPLPAMTSNTRGMPNLEESDVYLYPAGMNAIFNAHRALLHAREPAQSINFGFPYVDTLKILQKFGPGCLFYGHASAEDLDDLEARLKNGERFLGLFCEFPGNPLLTCPDLTRIRKLADEYDFAVVVDETIGTFANINVLPVADVVVSSLTKIFSGDSNVMGGGLVLNPESKYYRTLKTTMNEIYEDNYWPEDVIFMERNSRDFESRVVRINANSDAICEVLRTHPLVKSIYYPKYNDSKSHYEKVRLPDGGYGGLLSVVFQQKEHAQAFFDALPLAKGPSLGTNFTLASPYVLLAHYQELEWAGQFGVDPYLVRVSVGLEETTELQDTFTNALKAAEAVSITS